MTDRPGLLFPRVAAPPGHRLDARLARAGEPDDLGARQELDVRRRRDAIDQVLRHARREARATHQHPHLRRMHREKNRGLPGGVAAADQHDFFTRAHLRLDRRGPVPDAAAFHRREIGAIGTAVARAGGDHHSAAAHRAPVGELQQHRVLLARALAIEAPQLHRDQHPRAEFLRLGIGAPGKCLAGNAGRKAEIVLDARARASLPAEGARVDHQHRQPFRAGVDRGGETGGSRAGDRHVVNGVGGPGIQHADAARELALGRIAQHLAVGADRERQLLGLGRVTGDERLRVAVAGRVEQLMRNAVAAEEAAQARDIRRLSGADQHRAARARLDQRHTTQDHRAHQLFAERGFRDQQRVQLLGVNLDYLGFSRSDAIDEGRPARELAQLA